MSQFPPGKANSSNTDSRRHEPTMPMDSNPKRDPSFQEDQEKAGRVGLHRNNVHKKSTRTEKDHVQKAKSGQDVDPERHTAQRCLWKTNGQICMEEFSDSKTFSMHINYVHQPMQSTDYVCRWNKCNCAEKTFESHHQFKNHIRLHTRMMSFVCGVCKKGFSSPSQLKVHERTHTGQRPYQCNKCFCNFATSSNLRRHMNSQTCDKRRGIQKCPKCNKSMQTLRGQECVGTEPSDPKSSGSSSRENGDSHAPNDPTSSGFFDQPSDLIDPVNDQSGEDLEIYLEMEMEL